MTIYHNGECSKSRGALEILREQRIPHEVRWYIADPLTAEELIALLQKLRMSAKDLVRTSEPYFSANLQGQTLTENDWIAVLLDHPELIERPIVEHGDKAIIARPPERVTSFFENTGADEP